MNSTIIASIITGAVSILLSYLTAHFTSKHEIAQWKRADQVQSRKATETARSEIYKWLTQTHNLYQKQKALTAASTALTFAEGESAVVLSSLLRELSKDPANESIVRSLINRFPQ